MIIGPIYEELIFRKLIYNLLKYDLGVKISIILSSFLFGFYHYLAPQDANYMNWFNGIVFFGAGILFAWVYEVTGKLRMSIIFHSFWYILIPLTTFSISKILPIKELMDEFFYGFSGYVMFGSIFGVGQNGYKRKKSVL